MNYQIQFFLYLVCGQYFISPFLQYQIANLTNHSERTASKHHKGNKSTLETLCTGHGGFWKSLFDFPEVAHGLVSLRFTQQRFFN